MNVPVVAVQAIARMHAISFSDEQSECIDEDSLGVFCDAYIRKLKAYFRRTQRMSAQLGPEDILAFVEFCEQFKKPTVSKTKATTWDDIDEEAIRDNFVAQLKEKSHSYHLYQEKLRIQSLTPSEICEEQKTKMQELNVERMHILRKITRKPSYLRTLDMPIYHLPYYPRERCKKMYMATHYGIYSREDGNDYLMKSSMNRRLINGQKTDLCLISTHKMVI